MTSSPEGVESSGRDLEAACRRIGLTMDDLWHRYFALGGEAGPVEVEAHVQGILPLPAMQRDLLAHAVNERVQELTRDLRVEYSFALPRSAPTQGPLAALVGMLTEMYCAPPERIARAVEAAGDALNVAIRVFLVDYEQNRLTAVVEGGAEGETLLVDGTLAGHSFRSLRVLSGVPDGQPELWIPLVDGVERLGVLRAVLPREIESGDTSIREQLTWVANLAGHLIHATTAYGDGLDAIRRTQRRSVSAELAWDVLPPLTAGSDSVVVTGLVQPVYDVGGDAFDYAISETTLSLAIFDANGHDLAAGLTVATAVAAYRNSRRAGQTLSEQTAAVDKMVAYHSQMGEHFVTGVLAELDLHTGRLRYVVAGHPAPLLVRNGRVVKRLDHMHRMLFGVAHPTFEIAEEVLEAGDSLLLFTDGIPEARDAQGRFFGEDRLVDFLQRETLAGEPPPETLRRLSRAIMAHQADVLQDDATVVLARWQPNGSIGLLQ